MTTAKFRALPRQNRRRLNRLITLPRIGQTSRANADIRALRVQSRHSPDIRLEAADFARVFVDAADHLSAAGQLLRKFRLSDRQPVSSNSISRALAVQGSVGNDTIFSDTYRRT